MMRIQAEQLQEEQHLQELAKLQQKVEEQKRQQASLKRKKEIEKKYRRLKYIAAAIIGLFAAFFGIPKLSEWIFPKTASIAIMRFTNAARDTSSLDLSYALPVLLSEDFARCENLTVISPSSSLLYVPDQTLLRKISSVLPVKYILTGTIQENQGRYTIMMRLIIPEEQKTILLGTAEGQLSTLHEMRTSIVRRVLEKMELKSGLPEITQPTNTNALANYLQSIHLMQFKSGIGIDSAKTLLRTALQIDPSFCLAFGMLADLELHTFYKTNDAKFLESATDYSQRALRCSPNIASAHRVLGIYNRLSQNYDKALKYITQSLTYLPNYPECYRELALLSLIAGRYEEANLYASNALKHDPKNAESQLTFALVQQIEQKYSEAENSYQQAKILGDNDSLLAANFLQCLWINEGKYNNVVQYCQQTLSTSPDDYRYYYWIGRAYQLSLKIEAAQKWLEDGLAITQRIIELDPNNALALAYTGLFYSRLGKFSDGETAMDKAVQLDSDSIEILFLRADLYSIQRNKQKALNALDKALKQKYDFAKLLNPDLSFISHEQEYLPVVTRKIEGIWP
jgi:tetratricopeptide (TPR) repeat protein